MRSTRRRLATGLALVAFLALGLTLATPPAATAAPAGDRTPGGAFSIGIDAINNGYNVNITHQYGPTELADFTLFTNTAPALGIGDAGNFTIAAGETKSYFFAVGYKCWAFAQLFWRKGSRSGPYFAGVISPTVSVPLPGC